VPYADPEKRRQVKRESARRRRQLERLATGEARPLPDATLPDPPGEEELLRILGEIARSGSVAAARLLLERLDRNNAASRPDESSGSVIADLAKRRAAHR